MSFADAHRGDPAHVELRCSRLGRFPQPAMDISDSPGDQPSDSPPMRRKAKSMWGNAADKMGVREAEDKMDSQAGSFRRRERRGSIGGRRGSTDSSSFKRGAAEASEADAAVASRPRVTSTTRLRATSRYGEFRVSQSGTIALLLTTQTTMSYHTQDLARLGQAGGQRGGVPRCRRCGPERRAHDRQEPGGKSGLYTRL